MRDINKMVLADRCGNGDVCDFADSELMSWTQIEVPSDQHKT